MKRCSRCKAEKAISEFHRSSRASDGRQGLCKVCQREANRESRLRHPEANRERQRRYTAKNAAAERERKQQWREANPEKRSAEDAVRRAMRRGVLIRPDLCEGCGTGDLRIEAHHTDYGQKLLVEWLCSSCHSLAHLRGSMA